MRPAPPSPGELVIERARLTGNGSRGALEAALAHVRVGDVTGGEEILLIPRFRAGPPLSARRSPGDFGARLTDQLRALRASASVNPHGPVPGAAALRFTSKARYAAWLVALWLEGPGRPQAVHSSVSPERIDMRAWLAREVLSDGPVLVATAAWLGRRRLLGSWLARLEPAELSAATASVQRAYGMAPASPRATPPRPATAIRNLPRAVRRDSREPALLSASVEGTAARLLAVTWAELSRDDPIASTLAPSQARLLLLVTVLARQPNLAAQLSPAMLNQALAPSPAGQDRPLPLQRLAGRQTTVPDRRSREPRSAPRAVRAGAVPDQLVPTLPGPRAPVAASPPGEPLEAPRRKAAPMQPASQGDPGLAMEAQPEPSAGGLDTEFGGVFFLVNALLALGLYPDFTRPLDKGLAPSPFWLIDRLAMRLFGHAYRRDPLHRWLAAVGLAGALTAEWRVAPRWLAGVPPATHGLRRSRARTILWDLRGFALVDVPGTLPSDRRVAAPYRCCGTLVNRLPPLPPRPMPRDPGARWIACLAEFLRVRLALASEGLDQEALRLPGRVTSDEERIEVRFELARLPIALRLAGLDRDPGWLPAEGRSLSFHFE
jgi:hypothetical protein